MRPSLADLGVGNSRDISDIDLLNIHSFADRVIKLAEYRKSLQDYLHAKMGAVAPNLQALIGDQVSRLSPPTLRTPCSSPLALALALDLALSPT